MPALPANPITPRREIKNYQLNGLINLGYVALGQDPAQLPLPAAGARTAGARAIRSRNRNGSVEAQDCPCSSASRPSCQLHSIAGSWGRLNSCQRYPM